MAQFKFEINEQANIAEIGKRVEEALEALEQHDHDSIRDHLLEIHSEIYPSACHTAEIKEVDLIEVTDESGEPQSDPVIADTLTRADAATFFKNAIPRADMFSPAEDDQTKSAAADDPFLTRSNQQKAELFTEV